MDRVSRSDPIVALFSKHPAAGDFVYRARTEMIEGEHNPVYRKSFPITIGGDVEEWQMRVYDGDVTRHAHPNAPLPGEECLIGYASFTADDLLGSNGHKVFLHLRHDKNKLLNRQLKMRASRVWIDVYGGAGFKPFDAPADYFYGEKFPRQLISLSAGAADLVDFFGRRKGSNPQLALFSVSACLFSVFVGLFYWCICCYISLKCLSVTYISRCNFRFSLSRESNRSSFSHSLTHSSTM
jgi:hypothetical protein